MRQGEFEVELLRAEDQQPYEEVLAPDGRIYVIISPGDEYVIRVRVTERPR